MSNFKFNIEERFGRYVLTGNLKGTYVRLVVERKEDGDLEIEREVDPIGVIDEHVFTIINLYESVN